MRSLSLSLFLWFYAFAFLLRKILWYHSSLIVFFIHANFVRAFVYDLFNFCAPYVLKSFVVSLLFFGKVWMTLIKRVKKLAFRGMYHKLILINKTPSFFALQMLWSFSLLTFTHTFFKSVTQYHWTQFYLRSLLETMQRARFNFIYNPSQNKGQVGNFIRKH